MPRPARSELTTMNGNYEKVTAALQRFPLLAGVSPSEIRDIAARCSFVSIPAHRRVFEGGERSQGLWVVTSGRIRLHHLMADGRQQIVGFQAPTTALDLSSALDGRPYTATATTLADAELVLAPRSLLTELSRLYPITIRNAIDLLCIEVRQRDITTAIAALKDARARIACALLLLARQFGEQQPFGVRINYRLTRQDIADRAGVTVETAIRVMSDLQQRGVIRTEAQIIDLLDIAQVRDSASCEDCQLGCSVFSLPERAMAPIVKPRMTAVI